MVAALLVLLLLLLPLLDADDDDDGRELRSDPGDLLQGRRGGGISAWIRR